MIDRAGEILANLEAQEYDPAGQAPPRPRQLRPGDRRSPRSSPCSRRPSRWWRRILRDLDVERMTPLAALNLLHSLKSRLG